jgi:dehydrogenase/reductase SDR family member 1
MAGQLDGRVALVTGASKNIGKGIAVEIGRNGAAVYLTARTLGSGPDETGSLRATAAKIEAAGGQAFPLACDHTDDAATTAVFEEITHRHGKLDLLVNVASPDFSSMVGPSFWELPFDDMTRCLALGPRSNFVTTSLAARLMIPQQQGLVVNVSSHGALHHLLSVPYGAGKAAIDKITADTALELRGHHVAVVSLWPGLVLTEGLLALASPGPDGRPQLSGLDISFGETPGFTGKACVALAADADVMARSGQAFKTTQLARDYGFAEDDGSMPAEFLSLREYLGEDRVPDYWKMVERFAFSSDQAGVGGGR